MARLLLVSRLRGPENRWAKIAETGELSVARFSELVRIEAAIKNKSSKELEWSLWYCRMRQGLPTALPSHVRYWAGIEEKVSAVMKSLRWRRRFIRLRRSGWGVGWDLSEAPPPI